MSCIFMVYIRVLLRTYYAFTRFHSPKWFQQHAFCEFVLVETCTFPHLGCWRKPPMFEVQLFVLAWACSTAEFHKSSICSDACMLGDWISSWGFQPKTQLPALCCILGFCLLMLADGTGCKFQPLAPANLPLDMRGAAKTSLFKPRKSLPDVQLTQLSIDFAWFHCVPHINDSLVPLSSPK